MGCSFLLILPYFSLVSQLFEMTIIARLFGTIGKIADWLIPEKWIDETLNLCDRLAEKWQEEWDQLKHLAGVDCSLD
jgi:hypothetical protein